MCNPASLILLPCHPPPIPTPPPPVAGPTHSLPETGPQQRGGWWRSGARAGQGASPMPPPVPGFHCPPPSLPAPCPLPLPLPLRLMALCCSQVMAVRGGRCAPAGEERRGGDRVDEALCDAERGLGPFLPTGVAFSGAKSAQNAQNFPRPGALPPDPRQHTVLLPMRVARGGGETRYMWRGDSLMRLNARS